MTIEKFIGEICSGKSTNAIISSMNHIEIKGFQCIETQMAMLSVVSKITSEADYNFVIEEYIKKQNCNSLLNTIGTNVFVHILQYVKISKEDILKLFCPSDFSETVVKKTIVSVLNLALLLNSRQVENVKQHACFLT